MIRRILLASMLASTTGCTILDLWDTPVVVVDNVSCNDDTDCTTVQFEIPEELEMQSCIVPVRSCDTGAGRCTVALRARDTDADGFRDIACATEATEFAPRAVDCDDDDAHAYPDADEDHDGFFVAGCSNGKPEDCDDTRATAFPGASVEACDGVVSNCPDTSAPVRRREEDFDGDRKAAVGLDEATCVDVFDGDGDLLSFARTDCDDVDPRVYPRAPDICDGRNNDCLNVIGVGVDLLEDADGDGFAPPTTTACLAGAEGGFPATDCDDSDAKTYPAAPESCDLLVNDCSARSGSNFERLSEDPDRDGFYASTANCVDPVANIECGGAAFDPFAQYCAPANETSILGGVITMDRLEGADVNLDGIEDVLVGRSGVVGCASDTLQFVFSSNGATPLATIQNDCTGAEIRDIEFADIDGNSDLEVVVVEGTSVRAYDYDAAPGAAADRLKPQTAMYTTSAASPVAIVVPASGTVRAAMTVADVDGIAGLELVAVEGSSLGYRSLNTDMEDLADTQTSIATYVGGVTALWVADVTNDGRNDVVVAVGAEVRIHAKSSGAGFDAVRVINLATVLAGIGNVVDIAIADVEGGADGDADIVVHGSTGLGVLANRAGTFEGVPVGVSPTGAPLAIGAIRPSSISVRDLDGNRSFEILYSELGPDTLAYVDELGTNVFAQHSIVSDFDGASRIAGADVDGDRDVDILGYASNQAQFSWFESTFVSKLTFSEKSVDRAFDVAADVEVGDADSDGRLDVVAMSGVTGGEIHLWRSRSATASSFDESVVYTNTGSQMTGIALGDGNGDDALDIAAIVSSTDAVSFIRGNGDRTFAEKEVLTTFDAPSDVEMADLDGDGSDELIVASNGGTEGRIAIYTRQAGQNSFVRSILASGTAPCRDVGVGNLDTDGRPDVVVACGTSGLFAFRNPGTIDGAWETLTLDATVGADYGSADLTDLDRDGDDDVVAYRVDAAKSIAIQLFESGVPSGAIRLTAIDVNAAFASVEIVDLDRDGDSDIVLLGQDNDGAIRVLQAVDARRGRYVVQTLFEAGSGSNPSSVASGDLDGDGDPDVLATLKQDSDVIWWATGGSMWWDH